MHHDSCNFGG